MFGYGKTCALATTAAVALMAGGAAASTLDPVALLDSTATVNFSAQDGLSVAGGLTAEYRTPTGGPVPYIFKTALDVGPATVTPDVTISTPAFTVNLGIFGSYNVPSLSASFNVPIPVLPAQANVYDATYVSPALPLGAIFGFDYGTPLFGFPLTFGQVVQDQFETGEANVNVAGGLGPFGATFDYDGTLDGSGEVITATYGLTTTDSGILGDIEAFALGLLNDGTTDLIGAAFDLLGTSTIASGVCAGAGSALGFSGFLAGAVNEACADVVAGLVGTDFSGLDGFGFTVDSLGAFTADVSVRNSITPVPLPAAGLLLLGGLGAFGIAARRKRRMVA